MPNKPKITVKQLDKLVLKSMNTQEKWSKYVDYLLDFQDKYLKAIADGTTPPHGPKNPPGTGK